LIQTPRLNRTTLGRNPEAKKPKHRWPETFASLSIIRATFETSFGPAFSMTVQSRSGSLIDPTIPMALKMATMQTRVISRIKRTGGDIGSVPHQPCGVES
jgi:hypothetical protein